MADKSFTKSSRKNFYRRAVKRQFRGDSMGFLKDKREKAKNRKDREVAKKYQDAMWVHVDLSNGQQPPLDKDKLQEALRLIPWRPGTASSSVESPSGFTPDMKVLMKKQQRLPETLVLKERLENGDKLELSQIEKIGREQLLRKEIQQLEEKLGTTEPKS